MALVYLTLDQAVDIHRKTVEVSGGGSLGVLELGKLESVLHHIQNDDYYPTFVDKLTHLFFCACEFHCFADGNKRIAITLSAEFLIKNGYMAVAGIFFVTMENISYHLAASRIDKDFLREIIDSLVYEEDFSEEIKLKLIHCISDENNNEW